MKMHAGIEALILLALLAAFAILYLQAIGRQNQEAEVKTRELYARLDRMQNREILELAKIKAGRAILWASGKNATGYTTK